MVVDTLQLLEFFVVATHFRKRRNEEDDDDDHDVDDDDDNHDDDEEDGCTYLANRAWYFVSRLIGILREGPKTTKAPSVEAEFEEIMEEIKNVHVVIRKNVAM